MSETVTRDKQAFQLEMLLMAMSALALGGLAALVGGALLYRSTLPFQINYNEGWNSYFTDRVLQGLPLYPDRGTRLINNYPPLSFYVVAALSYVVGPVWIAGRVIAWASFLGCTGLIMAIGRAMGSRWPGTVFGGLFFAALMVTRFDLYVGMFDPQLLGHALMLTGLLVLVRRWSFAGAASAALLMVAAGFVKHSLVALPVSVTLWLLLSHRRLVLPWVAAGGTACAAGLLGCRFGYGPEFWAGLTAPRAIDWADGARKLLRWTFPLQLPCLLALLPWALRREGSGLIAIYAGVSLGTGLAGAAGVATNYNMVFDFVIAISLGVGMLVGTTSPPRLGAWASAAGAGCVVLSAAQLATAETTQWSVWSANQQARAAEVRAEVALIRERPGPALCGDLLLCYMAGKPFAYDPLNFGQGTGETQSSLRQDIRSRGFGAIQISPENSYLLPASRDEIYRAYVAVPLHPMIFVPK